jgi:hypothetical protein
MCEWRYSSTILDLGTGDEWSASHLTPLSPGKEPPVFIGQEARWAPEFVWKLLNREKPLAPNGNQTSAV